MTDERADPVADLVARLRRTPLYHGHGEESDLPEEAAATIERLTRERDGYASRPASPEGKAEP